MRPLAKVLILILAGGLMALPQVIRFESGGLEYQALSRDGVTAMFAHLPSQVREYAIVQAAVSNGSQNACVVRPENFIFQLPDGRKVPAAPAELVVKNLLSHASRTDVIRLVTTYEISIYGLTRFRSTSGYEQRRQAAQAALTSPRLSAAAAASAIAFVETKLAPGESTDGALFFPVRGQFPPGSRLTATLCNHEFLFEPEPQPRSQ